MIVGELAARLRKALAEYGIENPAFEAEQLMIKAGIPKQAALWEPREAVSPECEKTALALLEKRLSGYPLQYLIGEWDFYACTFKVGEGVLIPRQDTEALAELADGFLKKRAPDKRRVLDLCAGSGCIGIVLARVCGARVTCVERSEAAFSYLEQNIALNGVCDRVSAVCGDIFSEFSKLAEIGGEYDAIVSNPPYLTAAEMGKLQREVTFEPREALYGGDDGLEFYRKIPERYLGRLAGGGLLAMEIGYEQAEQVALIFKEYGLEPQFKNDLCGVRRVIYGIKKKII